MFARLRVVIGTACLLMFGAGLLFIFGPTRFGTAGQFDQLMDEAVERGVQVDAARSRRDAADAGVRKAWSRFLPSVNAYGEFGTNRNNAFGRLNHLDRNHHDNSRYGVSASLPIFRGGQNYYGLKGAKATAVAEEHSFHEARQLLLLDTARAILGIIRDREIVQLQRDNQDIVSSILRSTEARFRGGEATRTDIAIAKDQLTATQAVYTQAIDNLRSNETEFHRLIGRAPGRLSLPHNLESRLPKNLDEAIALAEQQNPQLLAAMFRSEAADHSLSASYGKFLPKVDLNMDYSEDRYHDEPLPDESDFSVKLNFSIPLFQPEAYPERDESKHLSEQRRFEARDARLTARSMATIAWRSYHTAKKKYFLALSRIRAAKAASHGMRRELEAGQRNVLDVLDTQERLVEAKVSAANAKYERYMAAHLLLSAIGQLDSSSHVVEGFKGYVNSAEKVRSTGDTGWKAASILKPLTTGSLKKPGVHKQGYRALGHKVKGGELTALSAAPAVVPQLPVLKPATLVRPLDEDPYDEVKPSKIAHAPVVLKMDDTFKEVSERSKGPAEERQISASKIAVTDIKPLIKKVVINKPSKKKESEEPAIKSVAKRNVQQLDKKKTAVLNAVNIDKEPGGAGGDKGPVIIEQIKKSKARLGKSDYRLPAHFYKKGEISCPLPATLNKEQVMAETRGLPPLPSLKEESYQERGEIITGSLQKVQGLKAPSVTDHSLKRSPISGGNEPGIFQAFRIHKIPLPHRKGAVEARRKVIASQRPVTHFRTSNQRSEKRETPRRLKKLTKPVPNSDKRAEVEVYPDTLDNRFSMWWNKQVDKVIGAKGGPKKVLVPLEKYRKAQR